MLDPRRLRQDFSAIKQRLQYRGEDISELDRFPEVDEKRRAIIYCNISESCFRLFLMPFGGYNLRHCIFAKH